MPPPPSPLPSARSPPRRPCGRLCLCLILLPSATTSIPRAAAFAFHRSVGSSSLVPAVALTSRARPSATNPPFLGASPSLQFDAPHHSAKRQTGGGGRYNCSSMSMSAASNRERNESGPRTRSKRPAVVVAATATATAVGLLALASGAAVANAAKNAAPEAAAAAAAVAAPASASSLVLPPLSKLALACLLPTLLGYYRSEYGVSYGYGTAIAASSYMILSSVANAAGSPLFPTAVVAAGWESSPSAVASAIATLRSLLPASLPAFHAAVLLFYGARLDVFLLYREVFLARFRAMRERIEERARKQGGRWRRTPFLLSCAFLYFCMACPLLVTSTLCEGLGMMTPGSGSMMAGGGGGGAGLLASVLEGSLRTSVVVALLGFLLGAVGDLNKTVGKALGGEDALVTGGVFRFFRHPNYTGEVIGWVSSCLAGFLAVAWKTANSGGSGGLAPWRTMAPYLLLSVMGATGISFVLATATTGLEYRQKEKYGDTAEYQEWIKKSWVGFMMAPAKKDEEEEVGSNGGDGDEVET